MTDTLSQGDARKLWPVGHPTWRYVENVKELARKANLIVVDAAELRDDDYAHIAKDVPKLTLRDEAKRAPASKT